MNFVDDWRLSTLSSAVARFDLSIEEKAALALGGPVAVLEMRGLDPEQVYSDELTRRMNETRRVIESKTTINNLAVTGIVTGWVTSSKITVK